MVNQKHVKTRQIRVSESEIMELSVATGIFHPFVTINQ